MLLPCGERARKLTWLPKEVGSPLGASVSRGGGKIRSILSPPKSLLLWPPSYGAFVISKVERVPLPIPGLGWRERFREMTHLSEPQGDTARLRASLSFQGTLQDRKSWGEAVSKDHAGDQRFLQ